MVPAQNVIRFAFIVGLFTLLGICASFAVWYFALRPQEEASKDIVVDAVPYTYEEKEEILKQLSVSSETPAPATTSPKTEQGQVLESLRTPDTAPAMSDEDKLRVLQSL